MPTLSKKTGGYVCAPYLHNHESIELKDLWTNSRNIESMFFVTATFSEDSKPYFSTSINHYILVKCKNTAKTKEDIKNFNDENPYFVFNSEDIIFKRDSLGKTNFVSIYYLEYGDSINDLEDIALHAARREKISISSFGNLEFFSSKTPKFTFPYSNNIVTFEIFSDKSHQSDNKYCEQTRRDICRKGIVMNNLVSFSILETLK